MWLKIKMETRISTSNRIWLRLAKIVLLNLFTCKLTNGLEFKFLRHILHLIILGLYNTESKKLEHCIHKFYWIIVLKIYRLHNFWNFNSVFLKAYFLNNHERDNHYNDRIPSNGKCKQDQHKCQRPSQTNWDKIISPLDFRLQNGLLQPGCLIFPKTCSQHYSLMNSKNRNKEEGTQNARIQPDRVLRARLWYSLDLGIRPVSCWARARARARADTFMWAFHDSQPQPKSECSEITVWLKSQAAGQVWSYALLQVYLFHIKTLLGSSIYC